MTPPRLTLEARLLGLMVAVVLLAIVCGALIGQKTRSIELAIGLSLVLMLPFALFAVRLFVRPIGARLRALSGAIAGLREGDFSLSLVQNRGDELGDLAAAYNQVGEILRRERMDLHQRELLLDTVMQTSPQMLLLIDQRGFVLYSNIAARRWLADGHKLEGLALDHLLQTVPTPLREAIDASRDGLYSLADGPDADIVAVTHHRFVLNSREHRLIQLRSMTREINRQELETWKKVIRVISHELNNSLAPISSMAHSGRLLLERGDSSRLAEVLATIGDRTGRLKGFLDEYARFAKLPQPRPVQIDVGAFLAQLRETMQVTITQGPTPAHLNADPGQLEQVLINLVKNAREAGGDIEAIQLDVRCDASKWTFTLSDRGPGMSDAVIANALVPFYTTKATGSGLGLTLCREIVEAHGGRMSFANRDGGGLVVRIRLPVALAQDDPVALTG